MRKQSIFFLRLSFVETAPMRILVYTDEEEEEEEEEQKPQQRCSVETCYGYLSPWERRSNGCEGLWSEKEFLVEEKKKRRGK
jgi:hypothetical protein